MANIFVISDTHFGHSAMLSFQKLDGSLCRSEFKDVTHMDETMVDNWNSVVKPSDHVYHLGDVAMKKDMLAIVKRLNGKKRLIFGNHDIFDYKFYAEAGFQKLMGMRVISGVILTHVPIHADNLGRFRLNIHGHTHYRKIDSPEYVNVCVEHTGYRPIPLDSILSRV